MKKKCIAIIIAAAIACLACVPAFAGNSSFTLSPSVGNTVRTGPVQKDDYESGVVNLKTGLLLDYVTFRIRTSDGDQATDYVDAAYYQKYYLAYYSGYNNAGDDYRLYSSYDSGQWRNGTTVTGIWAP